MTGVRRRAPEFVVLMGPPGSGKTFLGHALEDALDAVFVEGERLLLERYGSTENFLRHKAEALDAYYAQLVRLQQTSSQVVVFESTGHSDRARLLELCKAHDCALVGVSASRETCVARVGQRAAGNNFSNSGAAGAYDLWHAQVAPQYAFEQRADTESTPLGLIVERLAAALCLARV